MSPGGLYAWDVDRLIVLSAAVPKQAVALDDLAEVDSDHRFDHGYEPTVRSVVEHLRLVEEADLSYAIILDPEGRTMDGMHRVAQALLGHSTPSRRSA